MSRHAEIAFPFGDGEHTFRLGIGQLRELQEKTDAGPMELANRLQTGHWRVDDLREPIRLGLIGGGMEPVKALSLVGRYVDNRPLVEAIVPALAILMAAISGAGDEPLGKPDAEGEAETRSPTESSPSAASTGPGPSLDTPQSKSTE